MLRSFAASVMVTTLRWTVVASRSSAPIPAGPSPTRAVSRLFSKVAPTAWPPASRHSRRGRASDPAGGQVEQQPLVAGEAHDRAARRARLGRGLAQRPRVAGPGGVALRRHVRRAPAEPRAQLLVPPGPRVLLPGGQAVRRDLDEVRVLEELDQPPHGARHRALVAEHRDGRLEQPHRGAHVDLGDPRRRLQRAREVAPQEEREGVGGAECGDGLVGIPPADHQSGEDRAFRPALR